MKKLLVLLTLIISACSNPNQQGPVAPDEVIFSDKEVEISELVTLSNNLTIDGAVSEAGSIDFVSSTEATSLTKNIKIKNASSEPRALDFKITTDPNITLTLNRCPAILAPNKDCTIQLTLKLRTTINGETGAFLQVMSVPTILGIPTTSKISNSAYIPPSSDGTVNDLLISMPSFDDYQLGTRVTKTATLTNTSPTKSISNLSFTLPTGFRLVLSRCGTSLAARASCTLQVYYSGPGAPNPAAQLLVSDGTTVRPVDVAAPVIPITYSASFSAYFPAIPSSSLSCDGTVTSTRTMTCTRSTDNAIVDNSFCPTDLSSTIVSQSPAGIKRVDTLAGYGNFSCPIGSTTMAFVAGFCDNSTDYEYIQSGNSGNCVLKYTATIASTSSQVEYSQFGVAAPPTVTIIGSTASGAGVASTGSGFSPSGTGSTATSAAGAITGTPITSILDLGASRSITVNLTSAGILSSCTSPYISITGCSGTEFSFFNTGLKDIVGPFVVNLNNSFNLTVPYKVYTAQQISNSRSAGYDQPGRGTEFNEEFYFGMLDPNLRYRLFKLNKSGAIFQVSNMNAAASDLVQPSSTDSASTFVVFNNELYFSGFNSAGFSKLFKINTSGVISQVSNIFPSANENPRYLTIFNSQLYFAAGNSNDFNTKIFRLSSGGAITQVSNTRNANNDNPTELTVFNGDLYFIADVAGLVRKLFKITTANVSTRVSNTVGTASVDDGINGLYVFNNHLYFGAFNSASRFKVHKMTTGQVITQVSNTNTNGNDLSSPQFMGFNSELYFASQDSSFKMKLFKLTTSDVTIQVSNWNGSSLNENPAGFIVYNSELYMSASTNSGSTNSIVKINSLGVVSRLFDRQMAYGSLFDGSLYVNSTNPSSNRLFKITSSSN